MSGGSLLVVNQLSKAFGGVQAVRGLDFHVKAGEMLAMIGPNGAGKSTCFNLLNGQLRPDRGQVYLDGNAITGLAARRIWRLGIGRTFQIAAAFSSMTVRENVQMALLSHHRRLANVWLLARAQYRTEAEQLLERVGLRAQAERACSELAYGEIKRVELAVALASTPRLLLMDEPAAGMAPSERAELMTLIAAIVKRDRLAVLFTEHDMDVVFNYADRVIVLSRGRMIASGEPTAVRADPEVQRIYLGSRAQH